MTKYKGGRGNPNEFNPLLNDFCGTQDETMFIVKFVIVYVILDTNRQTRSFPENSPLLLPIALTEGSTAGGTKK